MQQMKQAYQSLKKYIDFAADLYQDGMEHEILLAKCYCQFVPNVEEQEGNWMARHVLEQIRLFEQNRERMLKLYNGPEEEKLAVLGEEIINRMEGFVVTSQCRKLYSINQAMEVLDALYRGTCSFEDAVAMTPAGYRGNTGEKGRNGELRSVLDRLFMPMEKTVLQNSAERTVCHLREDWTDDTLFQGVLTISLYAMMVNGAWPSKLLDLPVSIEYIVVAVCTLTSPLKINASAVKMFLLSGFLSAGTPTVMFIGSAVMIYATYYLTDQIVSNLILESGKIN